MDTMKSSSHEQREIEIYVFKKLEEMLQVSLQSNPKVILTEGVHIEPDFYSEEEKIVGEIFAHHGKLKVGQSHKVAQDILKMLLLDKMQGVTYRKYLVVCDKEIERALTGKSALAESIRQFDVQLVCIVLPEDLRDKILAAQNRQVMVNR